MIRVKVVNKYITGVKVINKHIIGSKVINKYITGSKVINKYMIGSKVINKYMIGSKVINKYITGSKVINKYIIGSKVINKYMIMSMCHNSKWTQEFKWTSYPVKLNKYVIGNQESDPDLAKYWHNWYWPRLNVTLTSNICQHVIANVPCKYHGSARSVRTDRQTVITLWATGFAGHTKLFQSCTRLITTLCTNWHPLINWHPFIMHYSIGKTNLQWCTKLLTAPAAGHGKPEEERTSTRTYWQTGAGGRSG